MSRQGSQKGKRRLKPRGLAAPLQRKNNASWFGLSCSGGALLPKQGGESNA